MTATIRKVISLALVVSIIAIYFYAQRVMDDMQSANKLEQDITIIFRPGENIRTLGNELVDMGLLDNRRHLLLWGKLNGQDKKLQAGEYLFTDGQSIAGLLDDMVAGKVIQHGIRLTEGQTFRQVLSQMHASDVLDKTLEGLSDEEIMIRLGHEGEHPEGRFYPDTYYVSRGMSDLHVLKRAYDSMQQVLAEEWQNRSEGLPLKSAYEALILASIVEKETGVPEERPLIAGVFINRLNRNMRLQTDPTVIYGIKNYDGDIRFRDLKTDTPYNTYTRHGLPPTPIALAGREAIHATLHPETTDYLFFVAYGDKSGRHEFSTNLEDHEKAVDKYQRQRRK